MFRRLVILILIAIGLTGCVQLKSGSENVPDPRGTEHNVIIIVEARIAGKLSYTLPVHYHADVTIPDRRAGAKPGAVEHGISVRSGHPYPDKWDGVTAGPTIMYYWSGSNPTTFTLGAQLDASSILYMSDHVQIVLTCTVHKDGELIHLLDEKSHVWETITVEQAKGGMIKSISVLCIWTDNS